MIKKEYRVFEVGGIEVTVVNSQGKRVKAKKGEFIIFDKDGKNPVIVSKEVYEKVYKDLDNGIHSVS